MTAYQTLAPAAPDSRSPERRIHAGIADDKQMMRDSVGATLQRAGYQIVAASDGTSAINAVDAFTFPNLRSYTVGLSTTF